MELSSFEQAGQQLKQSRSPVIIIPESPSSDALASGLALVLVLEKMGKQPRLISPQFTLPPGHSFLPKHESIQTNLTNLRNFVIQVDVQKTKLETLSYDIKNGTLLIYLTPKQGLFEERDVRPQAGPFTYDTIIILDTPTLEKLGGLYKDNAEFFYHTPIINIDHRPNNERYGQINIIELVASSIAEIIFELISSLNQELLDEHIATSLLTGIISKTKTFQNRAVTPRSLAIASHLVSAGARREDIIRHLYQTKSLSMLKLWGLALTTLQSAEGDRVVWSSLRQNDLDKSGVSAAEAMGVLDELMINTPKADFACLFLDQGQTVAVHIAEQRPHPNLTLPAGLTRQSDQYISGVVPGPMTEGVKRIVAALTAAIQ